MNWASLQCPLSSTLNLSWIDSIFGTWYLGIILLHVAAMCLLSNQCAPKHLRHFCLPDWSNVIKTITCESPQYKALIAMVMPGLEVDSFGHGRGRQGFLDRTRWGRVNNNRVVNDSFCVEVAHRDDRGEEDACLRARIKRTIVSAELMRTAEDGDSPMPTKKEWWLGEKLLKSALNGGQCQENNSRVYQKLR